MQYQRKRNLIYRKEIKNIQNFRINRSSFSKANDSTRDEETKNIKSSHPVKISEMKKFENFQYQNIKEMQMTQKRSIININMEMPTIFNAYKSNQNNNERRRSSLKLDSSENNNDIYLNSKQNKNNNITNHVRYNSTSNYNSHDNSSIKNINPKEEYKTNNNNESFISQNVNNNDYIYNNSKYNRYNSDKRTIKKQINLNCYNKYNYSKNTPSKKEYISNETRRQSIDINNNNNNNAYKSDFD